MKYITLALILVLSWAFQRAPAVAQNSSTLVVGSVVRYDASMSTRTSQGDLILKLKSEGESKYTRLRYAPDGFGFDAPTASRDKLLPKEMFSDGRLVWTFHVHPPRNDEEKAACKFRGQQYAPDQRENLVEVERFVPIPGHENDNTPEHESLPCFIVEYWAKVEPQSKQCDLQPKIIIRDPVLKDHGIQLNWKIVNVANTKIFVYSSFLGSRRAAAWIQRKDGMVEAHTSLPSKMKMTAYGYPDATFAQIEPHDSLEGVFADPDPTIHISRSTHVVFFIGYGDDVQKVKEALQEYYLHGAGHPANPIVDWQCVASSNIADVH